MSLSRRRVWLVVPIALIVSLTSTTAYSHDKKVCRWDAWQKALVCVEGKERTICRWDPWLKATVCKKV